MGNCSSENHAKLFRGENFSNDPTAFRVFVKKKNKFIPGWLKINNDEILFTRGTGANNFQFWPLAYLRRYGYTCSGIFFFESGRRCATGEGLHTFQSHQAERIFHTVQSRIKIEEYARGSRASSVVSNNRANVLAPSNNLSRIHPVQRFSSEGSNNDFQRLTASPSNSNYTACPSQLGPISSVHGLNVAPPPYDVYYQRQWQETLNRRLLAAGGTLCNNAMSASVSTTPTANIGEGGDPYRRQRVPSMTSVYSVRQPTNNNSAKNVYNRNERPRSVVSAIEHGVYGINNAPFLSPSNNGQPPTAVGITNAGILPSSASSMFESYNCNNFPMNRSLNSSFTGATSLISGVGTSPWVSQQQLENEIVLEHVLSRNSRRNYQQQQLSTQQNQTRQQQQQQQQQQQNYEIPSSLNPTKPGFPDISIDDDNQFNDPRKRKYHSYVNVDFIQSPTTTVLNTVGGSTKELHRTNKSRQDFLSSQPGGFVFNNANNVIRPPPRTPSVASSSASTATTTLPPSHASPNEFLLRDQNFASSNPTFYKNQNTNRYQQQQFNPIPSAFHSYNITDNNIISNNASNNNDNNSNSDFRIRNARPPPILNNNDAMSSSLIAPSTSFETALNTNTMSTSMMVGVDPSLDFSNKQKPSSIPIKFDASQMKQNYVTLNISKASVQPQRNSNFNNNINNTNNTNNNKNEINENITRSLANGNCPKTRYALIDFDKTKTLEDITHQQELLQEHREDNKAISTNNNNNNIFLNDNKTTV